MNQLIKITENNGNRAVSARELYNFLEVTERFSNWFERQLQYGFVEMQDYAGCKVFNALANQTLQDYSLTINTAKEIAMVQRTDKGKQARQYFISMEYVAINSTLQPYKADMINSSLMDKKEELLSLIKVYLTKSDTRIVANNLGISFTAVRNVVNGNSMSERIYKALFERAMCNKKKEGKIFSYQEMIDTLKK